LGQIEAVGLNIWSWLGRFSQVTVYSG
jgi:hypothetical protein